MDNSEKAQVDFAALRAQLPPEQIEWMDKVFHSLQLAIGQNVTRQALNDQGVENPAVAAEVNDMVTQTMVQFGFNVTDYTHIHYQPLVDPQSDPDEQFTAYATAYRDDLAETERQYIVLPRQK
ncbi:hypothetical protein [Lactiplantibacillus fabifermentans]|uniref:Uncharacterized protein n=2 Tax=Lactiplantibacillus fabifermentans TaxID=483011 RepID=A0A0R2NTB1_9LACO|nr:hypothetical protein [Lactiplantibacillus fabifermentans]ETY73534.1 hypothetical protein LFAB_11870 [Lactiplantibacillus fabifermentans T30PCM01]KRO27277.1 hypothetical protein DY78_GL000251 [Lactiplantibacillus fabifermentans DSM 21115]